VTHAADGVLVVDKPSGPTSHDVVQVARRTFGARVGHTGTLDPLASGVLPLVVGRATRLAQFLSGAEKTYEATVAFGRETDTYDAAGQTTAESGRGPDPAALAAAVAALPGRRLQTPPVYSAKKIGGEAAHRLARRATPVVPAAVEVDVYEAELLGRDGDEARIRVRVSAGFYVRSMAHDLGVALGVGAHLRALRRTRSGTFALDEAVAWEQVAVGGEALAGSVVPLDRLLTHLAAAQLDADGVARVRHGQRVSAPVAPVTGPAGPSGSGTPIRLLGPDGQLVGIATEVDPAAAAEGTRPRLLQPAVILG
jgi:tRNA pseudouridine55 synthase